MTPNATSTLPFAARPKKPNTDANARPIESGEGDGRGNETSPIVVGIGSETVARPGSAVKKGRPHHTAPEEEEGTYYRCAV